MSSGGSAPLTAIPKYSTGATGTAPEPSAPYAQSAPAPSGGKGGYNPNPYSQEQQPQQPQVYMPPSQPTFYDQAFMQPRQPQVRSYGLGGMGGGNAYARPFRSYGSPIERAPPVDEMRYVAGPTPIQQRVMPDTPPMARPAVMPRREYPVGPTPRMPDMPMNDMQLQIGTGAREYPGPMPDMPMSDMQLRMPVEATRGVVPEPNYSGGLGSLFGGMSGSVPYPSSPKFNQPKTTLSPDQELEMQRYVAQRQGAKIENPQLLAQMEMAKTAEAQRAAELQRQKQQLLSQPYDPRQLIG
jgi:hypothetical protein